MLRSSISRAFGLPPDAAPSGVDPAAPRSRREAIRRLFRELEEALVVRIGRIERECPPPPYATPDDLRRLGLGPLRVGTERALLEGIELVLETPSASWRLLDTLTGTIRVDRVESGALHEVERIGVVRDDPGGDSARVWAPVRKPSRPGAGFRFTTVDALVASWVGEVERAALSARARADSGLSGPNCTES